MFIRTVAAALLVTTPALAADDTASSMGRAPTTWSGLYGGVTAGALKSDGEASLGDYEGDLITLDVSNGLFPDSIDGSDTSLIGGVTIGYNHQINDAWVAGVELDLSFGNSDIEHGFARVDPNPDPIFNGVNTVTGYRTELDGLATARVRLGYSFGDTLAYATGGIAAGRVTNSFSLEMTELGYTSPDWNTSGTRFGYVLGAGVEHRMTEAVSIKAEILSYDLKDATVHATDPTNFPGQAIDYEFDNAGVIGRIGLNFRF
ncbi:outer membrane protein [Amaricoccus tamworthensis]|uniref:outer membrane protein n=1 Tax=Amaricoccus tamworthensis TaxID=57002 RepID=UPI003C7C6E66